MFDVLDVVYGMTAWLTHSLSLVSYSIAVFVFFNEKAKILPDI